MLMMRNIKLSKEDKEIDYLAELHANIKKDRGFLEEFREVLVNQVKTIQNITFPEEDEDPVSAEKKKSFIMVQLSDGMARISDCLSKSNQQLVEMAKLTKKSIPKEKESRISSDDIFEQMSDESAEIN
jgi:hypothetical protein